MATDYARLAKRISVITTNCLLTAVILVAGLAFGRQVLRWWAADPAESAGAARPAGVADGLGDPSRLHVLRFGDRPWSLRRRSVSGTEQAAARALRASCRQVLRQGRPPGQRPQAAGAKLLGRLAAQEPVEEGPGDTRLYELREGFPMVVGTRPQPAAADRPPGGNLARPRHGVVVWGLAIPAGPEAWTVLTFQPAAAPAGEEATRPGGLPAPPGCQRTLSMRVAGGGAAAAFQGPALAQTYRSFYDQWFAARRWETAGGWQRFGSAWHTRYTAPGGPAAGTADVHFSSSGPDRCIGLLITTPGNTQPRGT